MRIVFVLLTVGLVCSYSLPLKAQSKPAEQTQVLLIVLEQEYDGEKFEVNFNPYSKAVFENYFIQKGFEVSSVSEIPLKSNELTEYNVVTNTGIIKGFTGYLYLRAKSNRDIQLLTEDGETAVVETEIRSINWTIDQKSSLEIANSQNVDLAILVNVQARDISNQLKNGGWGGQKSINVSANLQIIDPSSRETTSSHYQDVTAMATTFSKGIREGVERALENISLQNIQLTK